jgi:hypothetical protein
VEELTGGSDRCGCGPTGPGPVVKQGEQNKKKVRGGSNHLVAEEVSTMHRPYWHCILSAHY